MTAIHCVAVSAVMLVWIASSTPPAQAAPIFVNGNFEAGVSGGWDLMNGTNTPGWTITYGSSSEFPRLNLNVACGGPYGSNNEGCQFATLGGPQDDPGGGSMLAQTISGFTVGNSYELSWLQSSEFVTSDVINASILGASVLSQDFFSDPYPGDFWFGWQTMTFAFVADATTLTFQFHSYADAPDREHTYEPGLDDFKIAEATGGGQVPEPATFLLLGSGLVAIGRRVRRSH